MLYLSIVHSGKKDYPAGLVIRYSADSNDWITLAADGVGYERNHFGKLEFIEQLNQIKQPFMLFLWE